MSKFSASGSKKIGDLDKAEVSYRGTTTADGGALGINLICSALIALAEFNGNQVVIIDGACAGQARDINGTTLAGTVTPASAFDAQITIGTKFVIKAIRTTPAEVAALTTIVETSQYYDRIFFDSITGIAGTAWPMGTPQVPSDVIASVITMLAARNLNKIDVHGILTLTATMNHINFFGQFHEAAGDIVNLNGQDINDNYFEGLILSGAQGGSGLISLKDCMFNAVTGFRGIARNCALYGTLAVATGGGAYADFDHCTSLHGVVTVTLASPVRVCFREFSGGMILTGLDAGDVLVRGISGYLEVDDMDGGTLDIFAHGADIQINADCGGGTINIFGNARVVDNSAAGCTVNNYTVNTTQLHVMDFWSLPQEEVAVTNAAGDKALPSVTVGDLPGGATIVRAIAMFKFRMVENHTYAGVNSLAGAQEIQVAGSVDAINFVDTQFTLAQDTREGGDVIIGAIDIAATVNADGAYAFHWDLAVAQQDGIKFNDIQMGIRIWYSV